MTAKLTTLTRIPSPSRNDTARRWHHVGNRLEPSFALKFGARSLKVFGAHDGSRPPYFRFQSVDDHFEDRNPDSEASCFSYIDLYDPARLAELTTVFEHALQKRCASLYQRYIAYRNGKGEDMKPEEVSELLVELAPVLGDFVAHLFGVESERKAQAERIRFDFDTVFAFKNRVVDKAASRFKGQDPAQWELARLDQEFEYAIKA